MSQPAATPGAVFALPLARSTAHPCAYLPGRLASNEYCVAATLDSGLYQALMDQGFRRSGGVVYRPACAGCAECVPIRVPAAVFAPSRSQRRVLRRNADLRVEIALPRPGDDKWRLYQAYLAHQHGAEAAGDRGEFESFLYRSPLETLEMCYWLGPDLVAVGLVDVCPKSLSSVYFYFDPAHARRSLGTFGALCEIDECRRRGMPFWYVGYYVRGCDRMNYKAQFRPHELLDEQKRWRRSAESGNPSAALRVFPNDFRAFDSLNPK